MSLKNKILTDWLYAQYFESPYEEISHLEQVNEIDDQLPVVHYLLGRRYSLIEQYDKAIHEFEKSLEIYDRWGLKFTYVFCYTYLGNAYHITGEYGKERRLYNKAEQILPYNPLLTFNQAVLSLSEGRVEEANQSIDKYASIRKENSATEADIAAGIGDIYAGAQIPDQAEKYYRKALSLEPDNPELLNTFARFLIDTDINVKEGLELIDKALKSSPENYFYVDTKGWGLYKQGNYIEALAYLEKSWELKPIYDHEVYCHLAEVKRSMAARN